MKKRLLFLCLCPWLSLSLSAETHLWSGNGADGGWTTSGNFVPGDPVNPGDDLVFDGTRHLSTNFNDLAFPGIGSLSFAETAGAFVLAGNALGLEAGLINHSAHLQTLSLDSLTIGQSQSWDAGSGGLTVTSPIRMDVSTAAVVLTLTGSGDFHLSGDISEEYTGTNHRGSLLKTGGGTVTLSGNSSFTGSTIVGEGRLIVASSGALGNSRYADAAVADGAAAIIQINAGVSLGKGISVEGGGTVDNRGTINSWLGVTSSNGGTILNTGSITATYAYADGIFIDQNPEANHPSAITNTGGSITGTTGNGVLLRVDTTLINEAGGQITGNGADFDGIHQEEGVATITNRTGGTITGKSNGITLAAGGSVVNRDGSTIGTNGDEGRYGILATGAAATIENRDTSVISGRQTGVLLQAGGSLLNEGTITGALAPGGGNAGVSLDSAPATLINAGIINGGVLASDHAHTIELRTGSVINGNLTPGTHSGASLILSGTGEQVYSVAVTGTTGPFSGTLVKNGAGRWTLDRAFGPLAAAEINAGALIVNQTLSAPVTVHDGATLGGNGVLEGTLTLASGGILSPGYNPGPAPGDRTLEISGPLHLLSGSILDFGLEKTTGAALGFLENASLAIDSGAILRLTLAQPLAVGAGDQWQLLTGFTETISGSFTSTLLPTLREGLSWDLSRFNASGDWTVAVIPEPGSVALWLVGGGALAYRLRRRRGNA